MSGATSYTTQIVRRKFDYTESRTFDARPKAERWMKKREKEIDLDIEQGHKVDLSRFDAAPLIAFTATKEMN